MFCGGTEEAAGYVYTSGLKWARAKPRCRCLVNVLPSTGLTWLSPRHCLGTILGAGTVQEQLLMSCTGKVSLVLEEGTVSDCAG